MNHALLARLKRASSSVASSSSHSSSSTSQLGGGVDGNGNLLPAYNNNSTGQGRNSNDGGILPIGEKTLPPGAAAYTHPTTQWDQAQRERDELDRALKLSEEQDEYEAALRASQQAEEAENEIKRKELENEDEILRLSQADHEAHEDQLAIIQAEEEEAILKAIRESEREASTSQSTAASKGKQTRRRSSINSGNIASHGDSQDIDNEVSRSNSIGTDDDEDLRKAMELSMLDQEDERRQQEAMLEAAQVKRHSPTVDQASTSAISPSSPRSTSSSHPISPPRPGRAPPPPPHLLPPRPNQQPQAPVPSTSSDVETAQSQVGAGPTLPPRRRLSDDSAYQSIAEAPPPAYEASSTSGATAPSMSNAHSQSQSQHHQNSPTPPSSAEIAETGTGTWETAQSSETALEEARALEEKRQVFYPPVATSEMAEGSMRAFVPHMLFAARRRERSDPDEWLPMASRDVDLAQLSAQAQPQSPGSPTSQAPSTARRPRRPLPSLPAGQAGNTPSQIQPSALSQLDQKVASISPVSTTSPSYYTASIPPSSRTNDSIMAPSTTRAVENEEYEGDDPFDDSRAASTDEEYIGPGSDTDDYYNDHPSHTMHERHPRHADSANSQSQVNNTSQAGPIETATASESAETTEAPTDTSTPRVGRYDYARTRSREDTSHLPRAHSPQPMDGQQRINSEQQDLATGEGYMSGESAVSWESTASEDDEPAVSRPPRTTNESAQDINTNISFGFNPLSSPNAHLDWQGRFPDLIVLSRFADKDPRAAVITDEGTSSPPQSIEDYRTFAFEAPTWRELLAYLMWHGNAIFEAASRDKETSTPDSLRVSLILEFVKTSNPPSTLVRLQIHLLSTSMDAATAGSGNTPGARGVALSRQPLSSRPANYIRSTLPWQQPSNKDSTHLVLAFPKPYHTLPFTLGTIGTHLHNAHKAAVAQHTQQTDHRIQLGDKNRINSTQFLTDLLRGIDLCSDQTLSSGSQSRQQRGTNAAGAQATDGHASPDDSRFDRLVGRLKEKRHNMRGTLRELHKGSRSRRRRKQQAKDKGKGRLDGRAEDSDESYLESQPQAEDYHITPYPVGS